jgi:hypothetical protein
MEPTVLPGWKRDAMKMCNVSAVLLFSLMLGVAAITADAWDPVTVTSDPLVRMPGTQPGQVTVEGPNRCLNCHAGYSAAVEPGFNWKGSMMAQSARDFLFYACMTVAGQDSIWATGRPNAVDICERCHFPKGWLEGRSDPTNASAMTGADFDGVECDVCHRAFDPFFETTYAGTRESNDWTGYWDESNASSTPSTVAAHDTYLADATEATATILFDGDLFFLSNVPWSAGYSENGSGQYFIAAGSDKRASFADADARHTMLYSRHHKSRYFCGTCHDVSNPVLANLGQSGTEPLTTETNSAYSYYHVERTFSEFMLSDYGQQGGSAGKGYFAGGITTAHPGNAIASCQDCHMHDVVGVGCNKQGAILRPTGSVEHPHSGLPLHDLTGGNMFVSSVLASTVVGSPNYDATNASLLGQGPATLTLDLTAGEGVDPTALLAGVDRAEDNLERAATVENVAYDPATGQLSFRIQNNTGHKLISGFPEGRRMFVSIGAYAGATLLYHVNPYDQTAGTLKGLPPSYSPNSPALGPGEAYVDALVYEVHPESALTGEDETFHFALATGRYKDNRIPPKGFRIAEAGDRLSTPVWDGQLRPDYYTAAEYAGGYDDVSLTMPAGADRVEVELLYQTTSREYVEFLRDEINGTASTLTLDPVTGKNPAGGTETYIVQTDPFFAQLRAWGDTIWQLWQHNKGVPGAAPVLMAEAEVCVAPVAPVLAAPAAAASGADYTVSWTATSPDNTYELQEATDPSFSVATTYAVTGTSRVFNHAPASPTDYYYRVRATSTCGGGTISTWSNTGQTTVSAAGVTGFYTLTPCRVVDTRDADGPLGGPILAGNGAERSFVVTGSCGIPADATAISVNVTVTMSTDYGLLRVYPGNLAAPVVSTINFTAGRTLANNAILRLPDNGSGSITVKADGPAQVHFLLDVNGYFK